MMMNEEHFRIVSSVVENIIENDVDIRTTIENAFVDVPFKFKRQFYSHMNALFLNVLLNRLNEFNNYKEIEKKALESRKIICNIIEKI